MYIVYVIPLTKLPLDKTQIYTYFTSLELPKASLVLVPFYRRQVKALVIDIKKISTLNKTEIRKSSFELKQIIKVLYDNPLLTEHQLKLIQWMTKHYYAPLGLIVKTVLPEKLIQNPTKLNTASIPLSQPPNTTSTQKPYQTFYSIATPENRSKFYQKEIRSILAMKKQILILVPQAIRIEAMKECLENKFSGSIVSFSSNIKITELRKNWKDIRSNHVKIIIGTRSSLFMPFYQLGLIIVDEEENSGHLSWDMAPKYDARKVARKLAELHHASLIFGSGAPSVEYYHEAVTQAGQISPPIPVQLPFVNQRPQVMDMRQEIQKGNYTIFSDDLFQNIQTTLKKKGRIILFVNRRGSFRFTMCRDCGFSIQCPNCDVPMICHESGKDSRIEILKCHHCGHQAKPPNNCTRCGSIRIKGFGIGTQRVVQEIHKLFPKTNVIRIDSDSQEKDIASKIHDANIIVGTQMILSLPSLKKVDLIGIVAIDSMLNLPDFRSGERTFQIIMKLSNLSQKVFIQTYNPENSIIQHVLTRNYQGFYEKEIADRKELSYPPFSQLVKLTYRHPTPSQAHAHANQIASDIKNLNLPPNSLTILGPSPAFIARENNKWVWQIVAKIKDESIKNSILSLIPTGWEIEVDPESIL